MAFRGVKISTILLVVLVFVSGRIIGPPTLEDNDAVDSKRSDLGSLNFIEVTAKYGYKSEEHTVQTNDGYILRIFRIVRGKKCKRQKKQLPVILMHGLLLSADSWIDAGPEKSLAYLLSDECYDIWVGNQRGNYYTRRHKTHSEIDRAFWQFSVDEIGKYDIPAIIDYVLDYTGAEKVNYIGFSQGSGTFYIMCSERQGYCNKVNLVISVAPSTRHLNTKSAAFRILCLIMQNLQKSLETAGVYEIFTKGGSIQKFLVNTCRRGNHGICAKFLALIDAHNPGSIAKETMKLLYEHFPAGTSLRNMARYGQAMKSENFVKFDYGKAKNLQLYSSEKPPAYNLSAVCAPVAVIYGVNDGIVDKDDVKWLIGKLPNVVEVHEVENTRWTHLDHLYSRFIPEMTFSKVNEYLTKYSKGR